VKVADTLKKTIIPLLLEPMSWPPEGPMSLVFADLLYIDFCQRNIDVQFDKLIKHINGHIDRPNTVRITYIGLSLDTAVVLLSPNCNR